MVSLNDIIINERTFRTVLESVYTGTNISTDIRSLNLFRKGINNWESLSKTDKLSTYNKFISLNNVFDEYQLMRFFLSNLEKSRWPILATMADTACKLYPEYLNIHGKDVSILHLVDDNIKTEFLP